MTESISNIYMDVPVTSGAGKNKTSSRSSVYQQYHHNHYLIP